MRETYTKPGRDAKENIASSSHATPKPVDMETDVNGEQRPKDVWAPFLAEWEDYKHFAAESHSQDGPENIVKDKELASKTVLNPESSTAEGDISDMSPNSSELHSKEHPAVFKNKKEAVGHVTAPNPLLQSKEHLITIKKENNLISEHNEFTCVKVDVDSRGAHSDGQRDITRIKSEILNNSSAFVTMPNHEELEFHFQNIKEGEIVAIKSEIHNLVSSSVLNHESYVINENSTVSVVKGETGVNIGTGPETKNIRTLTESAVPEREEMSCQTVSQCRDLFTHQIKTDKASGLSDKLTSSVTRETKVDDSVPSDIQESQTELDRKSKDIRILESQLDDAAFARIEELESIVSEMQSIAVAKMAGSETQLKIEALPHFDNASSVEGHGPSSSKLSSASCAPTSVDSTVPPEVELSVLSKNGTQKSVSQLDSAIPSEIQRYVSQVDSTVPAEIQKPVSQQCDSQHSEVQGSLLSQLDEHAQKSVDASHAVVSEKSCKSIETQTENPVGLKLEPSEQSVTVFLCDQCDFLCHSLPKLARHKEKHVVIKREPEPVECAANLSKGRVLGKSVQSQGCQANSRMFCLPRVTAKVKEETGSESSKNSNGCNYVSEKQHGDIVSNSDNVVTTNFQVGGVMLDMGVSIVTSGGEMEDDDDDDDDQANSVTANTQGIPNMNALVSLLNRPVLNSRRPAVNNISSGECIVIRNGIPVADTDTTQFQQNGLPVADRDTTQFQQNAQQSWCNQGTTAFLHNRQENITNGARSRGTALFIQNGQQTIASRGTSPYLHKSHQTTTYRGTAPSLHHSQQTTANRGTAPYLHNSHQTTVSYSHQTTANRSTAPYLHHSHQTTANRGTAPYNSHQTTANRGTAQYLHNGTTPRHLQNGTSLNHTSFQKSCGSPAIPIVIEIDDSSDDGSTKSSNGTQEHGPSDNQPKGSDNGRKDTDQLDGAASGKYADLLSNLNQETTTRNQGSPKTLSDLLGTSCGTEAAQPIPSGSDLAWMNSMLGQTSTVRAAFRGGNETPCLTNTSRFGVRGFTHESKTHQPAILCRKSRRGNQAVPIEIGGESSKTSVGGPDFSSTQRFVSPSEPLTQSKRDNPVLSNILLAQNNSTCSSLPRHVGDQRQVDRPISFGCLVENVVSSCLDTDASPPAEKSSNQNTANLHFGSTKSSELTKSIDCQKDSNNNTSKPNKNGCVGQLELDEASPELYHEDSLTDTVTECDAVEASGLYHEDSPTDTESERETTAVPERSTLTVSESRLSQVFDEGTVSITSQEKTNQNVGSIKTLSDLLNARSEVDRAVPIPCDISWMNSTPKETGTYPAAAPRSSGRGLRKIFRCEHCSKNFTCLSSLEQHKLECRAVEVESDTDSSDGGLGGGRRRQKESVHSESDEAIVDDDYNPDQNSSASSDGDDVDSCTLSVQLDSDSEDEVMNNVASENGMARMNRNYPDANIVHRVLNHVKHGSRDAVLKKMMASQLPQVPRYSQLPPELYHKMMTNQLEVAGSMNRQNSQMACNRTDSNQDSRLNHAKSNLNYHLNHAGNAQSNHAGNSHSNHAENYQSNHAGNSQSNHAGNSQSNHAGNSQLNYAQRNEMENPGSYEEGLNQSDLVNTSQLTRVPRGKDRSRPTDPYLRLHTLKTVKQSKAKADLDVVDLVSSDGDKDSESDVEVVGYYRLKNPKEYWCEDCDKVLEDPSAIEDHLVTNHGYIPGPVEDPSQETCDICCRSYISKVNLLRHKIKVHGTYLLMMKKGLAKKKFVNKKKFQGQKRVVFADHLRRKFLCESCDLVAIGYKEIVEHVKTHDNDASLRIELEQICDVCEAKFPSPLMLLKHKIFNHSGYVLQKRKERIAEGANTDVTDQQVAVLVNPDVTESQISDQANPDFAEAQISKEANPDVSEAQISKEANPDVAETQISKEANPNVAVTQISDKANPDVREPQVTENVKADTTESHIPEEVHLHVDVAGTQMSDQTNPHVAVSQISKEMNAGVAECEIPKEASTVVAESENSAQDRSTEVTQPVEKLGVTTVSDFRTPAVPGPSDAELSDESFADKHSTSVKGRFDVKYVCKFCAKYTSTFTDEGQYRRHLKKHSPSWEIICPCCSKKWLTRSLLGIHLETCIEEHNFVCQFCGQVFLNKFKFSCHQRNHRRARIFCKLCNREFMRQYHLDRHVAAVHTGDAPLAHRHHCSQCAKSFSTKPTFKKHMKEHEQETVRRFKCPVCDSAFKYRHHLRNHMDSKHSGERRYECDVCEKKFTLKHQLQSHMRLHSGDLFKCDYCDSKTTSKAHLNIHIRNHHPEKAEFYTCKICSEDFTKLWVLNDHIFKVHGKNASEVAESVDRGSSKGTLLRCDICNAKFTGKYFLKKHMKTEHSVGGSEEADVKKVGSKRKRVKKKEDNENLGSGVKKTGRKQTKVDKNAAVGLNEDSATPEKSKKKGKPADKKTFRTGKRQSKRKRKETVQDSSSDTSEGMEENNAFEREVKERKCKRKQKPIEWCSSDELPEEEEEVRPTEISKRDSGQKCNKRLRIR